MSGSTARSARGGRRPRRSRPRARRSARGGPHPARPPDALVATTPRRGRGRREGRRERGCVGAHRRRLQPRPGASAPRSVERRPRALVGRVLVVRGFRAARERRAARGLSVLQPAGRRAVRVRSRPRAPLHTHQPDEPLADRHRDRGVDRLVSGRERARDLRALRDGRSSPRVVRVRLRTGASRRPLGRRERGLLRRGVPGGERVAIARASRDRERQRRAAPQPGRAELDAPASRLRRIARSRTERPDRLERGPGRRPVVDAGGSAPRGAAREPRA
jgi:hypothetical protein